MAAGEPHFPRALALASEHGLLRPMLKLVQGKPQHAALRFRGGVGGRGQCERALDIVASP